MDDEERWDYIAPTLPLQEAAYIDSALELTTVELDTHWLDALSLACDEEQRSPASTKRSRWDFNGGSLSNDLSTINQGLNNRIEDREINDLRLEVDVIKRQLTATRKALWKESLAAAGATKLLVKV
jgi:hypothetical protein